MTYEGAGQRFLVVDDDALMARSLARTIRVRTRRRVEMALDADAAVGALRAHDDYCGFVLDYRLGPAPSPDGFDLLAAARERFPVAVAVLLTGHIEPALVNRATRMGAMFLCKPASAADLEPFFRRALCASTVPDERVVEVLAHVLRTADVSLHSVPAEVLRLRLARRSKHEIVEALAITEHTLKSHVTKLLRATGAPSLDALVDEIRVAAMEGRLARRHAVETRMPL